MHIAHQLQLLSLTGVSKQGARQPTNVYYAGQNENQIIGALKVREALKKTKKREIFSRF